MSENMKRLQEIKIKRTIEALKENGINGYSVKDKEQLKELVKSIIEKGSIVTVGGSMTLFEAGIIDLLRNGDYKFLDRYKEGLTRDEIEKIYRDAFSSDYYITSTNALTEKGELYNVDGNGNRVAAMIYGPKKVIVIAGVNKIVKDINEAISRVENFAAPANAKRLNKKTPCTVTGKCMNCSSPERICREYTVIRKPVPNRIFILLLNEDYGY